MFYMEQPTFLTEDEALIMVQEASMSDPGTRELYDEIIIPIIDKLQHESIVKKYIQYGSDFLDANSEMLAKEYPTAYVSYPRKYVDDLLDLFGFTVDSLRDTARSIFRKYVADTNFAAITSSPTNILHAIVLVYADMGANPHVTKGRENLRDSARQQMGVTTYGLAMKNYWKSSPPNPSVMEYTYMRLDRSWDIVRDENIINWIGGSIETAYGFWRTKLSLSMSPQVLIYFLERVKTTMFQKLRSLATQYFKDIEEKNSVGNDTKSDDEYVDKNEFANIRNNLLRKIYSSKDELYTKNGPLYKAVSNLKNVKQQPLYDFAQKVAKKDVGNIIDLIFYVFITREGNNIKDINTTKYIQRITKFPTAVDRAIPGKPVILPMQKKYNEDDNIVKAYICLVAVYIMQRINDVKQLIDVEL